MYVKVMKDIYLRMYYNYKTCTLQVSSGVYKTQGVSDQAPTERPENEVTSLGKGRGGTCLFLLVSDGTEECETPPILEEVDGGRGSGVD